MEEFFRMVRSWQAEAQSSPVYFEERRKEREINSIIFASGRRRSCDAVSVDFKRNR